MHVGKSLNLNPSSIIVHMDVHDRDGIDQFTYYLYV